MRFEVTRRVVWEAHDRKNDVTAQAESPWSAAGKLISILLKRELVKRPICGRQYQYAKGTRCKSSGLHHLYKGGPDLHCCVLKVEHLGDECSCACESSWGAERKGE